MVAVDWVVKTELSDMARHAVERGLREESGAVTRRVVQ